MWVVLGPFEWTKLVFFFVLPKDFFEKITTDGLNQMKTAKSGALSFQCLENLVGDILGGKAELLVKNLIGG